MKKKQAIIGIDVSKSTLDVFIHHVNFHFIVTNNPKGFMELLDTICRVAQCKCNELLFCFENTGKYSRMLSVFLHTQEISFIMEPALAIKKSLGITRGKNDKVDARRIAIYAYERRKRLVPTVLPGEIIDRIKMLLSLRSKLIKHRTAFKNGITDLFDCYHEGETSLMKELQRNHIKQLNTDVEKIENEIEKLIESDYAMNENYRLIMSVKGVGKVNAFHFIAFTGNFTLFSNARAYSCYCGIAPFENSSGTIKGRTKVHHYANKQLKSLLNMAASSAIQVKGEYQQYYKKRIEQGKSKMSTLNIVRNKIVGRVFAVVNRRTPYVDLYTFEA